MRSQWGLSCHLVCYISICFAANWSDLAASRLCSSYIAYGSYLTKFLFCCLYIACCTEFAETCFFCMIHIASYCMRPLSYQIFSPLFSHCKRVVHLMNPSLAVFKLYVEYTLRNPSSAVFILHISFTLQNPVLAVFVLHVACIMHNLHFSVYIL